jgi:uncharacterized membrane protein YeaQ/YmgE (transglycosylase-associated protein family)
MGCLIVLAVLAVLFGIVTLVSLSFHVVGFLLLLLVAGFIGWLADRVVPGRLPGGWLGAVLAGIVGGFVGNFVLRPLGLDHFGPSLFGVQLIPAFVGAVVVALVIELLSNSRARRYME